MSGETGPFGGPSSSVYRTRSLIAPTPSGEGRPTRGDETVGYSPLSREHPDKNAAIRDYPEKESVQ